MLDVRPANLLLKALTPGARYFRGADTAAASAFMLAWPSAVGALPFSGPTTGDDNGDGNNESRDAAQDHGQGLFVLPNRGWLVKVADMGMAAAYRVVRLEPARAGARASVASTIAVGTERSSERVAAALDRRAAEARAAYDTARARALARGPRRPRRRRPHRPR